MSDQDYVFWIEGDKYCLQCGELAFPTGVVPSPNSLTDLIQCPKCERWARIRSFNDQETKTIKCKICSNKIDLKKSHFHDEKIWLCKSCASRFLIQEKKNNKSGKIKL